jgi:NifB/MoaA-like Fe-S oxidoreductase
LQYIYVAIYSVDDSDIADREIVNIVYDNNPNRDKVEIFQLNTLNAGDASNFVTYTSTQVPKVKFNSQFTTLRIKIFDVYGNVLLFDNTPYKSTDSIFTGSTVPDQFMNISIQFTLKKI